MKIERKGGKPILNVNDMELATESIGDADFLSNESGFFVAGFGKGKLFAVDEVRVGQAPDAPTN